MIKRTFTTLILLSLISLPSLKGQEADLSDKLRNKLTEIYEASNAPGVSFSAVLPDGKEITLTAGYADLEKKIEMEFDHKMLGGSTGKVFYSVVVMQLIEEGKLDLDAPVKNYLGNNSWFERLPNAANLTIRNLMRHESGIPRYVFKEAFQKDVIADVDRVWKPEELLSYVYDDKPLFSVGEQFAYSDTNYIIVAMVIEAVTGNDLYDEVQTRVLDRARLNHVVPQTGRVYEKLAQGYNGEDPFFPGNALDENGRSRYNWQFEWAGGGLVITTRDLAVLAKKIYEGEMFDKALLKEYFDGREATGMGGTWGLGVHIRNSPNGRVMGHSGFMPGYITNMMYFEDLGFSICYQINASDPPRRGILRQLPQMANIIRAEIGN
ncbi:serine hydrolase [Roseivirga sp. E12]|uniref:serine hydrolase domain-containing protein n=1 Tax=Roseivirga sp. E12 TaxID=2819237 RepID=UPI001ABD1017|nr:serine hydrolase domain-containing protein [Roseivirga sp. E12]MBO3696933.1 beta-lactamase family protein [Roseivirga sp. E12]